jgi:hypothetical protein
MEYFRQTIGSAKLNNIFELPPMLRNKIVEVIILPIENIGAKNMKREIRLGLLKDKVPPLPDSFFDPLPEEELRLWGL